MASRLAAVCLIFLIAASALAQPVTRPAGRAINPPPVSRLGPAPAAEEGDDEPFDVEGRLLGNLAGRAGLAESGVSVTAGLLADGLYVLDGPSERGEIRTLGVLDAAFDAERLGIVDGGTLLVRFYAGTSTDGADGFPATFQDVDNIPAFEHVTVGELWYEQQLFDGDLRLRAGRMDANSEFAFAEYAAEFVTDSTAVTPTNYGIPSFLDPALAVTAFAYPGDWSFGAGVFRGDLELPSVGGIGKVTFFDTNLSGDDASTYLLAEAGRRWDLAGDGTLPGSAKLGGWLAVGEFARLDGTEGDSISGGYLVLQQALYDEGSADQGLAAFAQLGLTDETFSEIEMQAAVGLAYLGLVPGRDGDFAGLYVSRAGLSDASGADFARDAEWVIEATYAIRVRPWLTVQPDVQQVLNAQGERRDVTLGVLRVVVNF